MRPTWSIVQIVRFCRPRCLNCLHDICDVFRRSDINICCTTHFILCFLDNSHWLGRGYPFTFLITLYIHSSSKTTKCIDISSKTLNHDFSFVIEQVITVVEVNFDSLNTKRHWTPWLSYCLENSLHHLGTKAPLFITHLMELGRAYECMGLSTSCLTICKHCAIVTF